MNLEKTLQEIKANRSTNNLKKGLKKKNECSYGCNNGWFNRVDKNGYLIAKECTCLKEKRMQNRLKFASLPEAFKDVELKNFRADVYKKEESKEDIKFVVKIIKEYFGEIESNIENGIGLYIYGETKGSGKTRLAISVANELIKNHNTQVKFSTSVQILNEIRKTWGKESEYTESKLLDDLSTVKVLIIDDFGTEKIKDWIDEKFYSIINERCINKKTTIYTSNYALEDLEYDERIKSRISEYVHKVSFPSEDIRGYIAEERNKEMLNKIMEGIK